MPKRTIFLCCLVLALKSDERSARESSHNIFSVRYPCVGVRAGVGGVGGVWVWVWRAGQGLQLACWGWGVRVCGWV